MPLDVSDIVRDVLHLLEADAARRSVDVEVILEPGMPAVVGDRVQLQQLMLNLMLNALDAMETGGRLAVRTQRGRRADEVLVEVEDTGSGIPPGVRTKIFEPFYTTKPQGRGTGLGLSICYGIVEEHRGRIEVDSQPGRGAAFRVFLPTGGTT